MVGWIVAGALYFVGVASQYVLAADDGYMKRAGLFAWLSVIGWPIGAMVVIVRVAIKRGDE